MAELPCDELSPAVRTRAEDFVAEAVACELSFDGHEMAIGKQL
jgi:hypothetical protein